MELGVLTSGHVAPSGNSGPHGGYSETGGGGRSGMSFWVTASSEPDPVRCDPNSEQTNVSATRARLGAHAPWLSTLNSHLHTLLLIVRSYTIYWLHDPNLPSDTR